MFKEADMNKRFVIGTPLVPWKVEMNEHDAWLTHNEAIREKFPNVQFFAALELDHRGIDFYKPFIEVLKGIGADYWTYTINDFEEVVDSNNRWIRIETGRNLVREYAQRGKKVISNPQTQREAFPIDTDTINHYEAILYVDSDIVMNSQAIQAMFEVDRAMVGINVPAYNLSGFPINTHPKIEEHWTTAGALLVNAPACWDLPWYHNIHMGLSDDPTFQYLGARLYGQTWVRKDLHVDHIGRLSGLEYRGIPRRVIEQ